VTRRTFRCGCQSHTHELASQQTVDCWSCGARLDSNDLQYIERFDLPDELLDSGHFTIIRAGEGWRVFFNCSER
jgi:hypothetical protein